MKILTSAAPRSKEIQDILRTPAAREQVITFLTGNAAQQSNESHIDVQVGRNRFSVSTNTSTSVEPREETK